MELLTTLLSSWLWWIQARFNGSDPDAGFLQQIVQKGLAGQSFGPLLATVGADALDLARWGHAGSMLAELWPGCEAGIEIIRDVFRSGIAASQ